MILYRFPVHNGHRHDDPDGTELADDAAALQEAFLIIGDLTKNNQGAWKGWTIDVTDGDREVWRIPFIDAV